RSHPGVQRRTELARARLRLDAGDRVLDSDPDPRLPARGPAWRANTRRRLVGPGRDARRHARPDPGADRPPEQAARELARPAEGAALGCHRRYSAGYRDPALLRRPLTWLCGAHHLGDLLGAQGAAAAVATRDRGGNRPRVRDRRSALTRSPLRDRVRALLGAAGVARLALAARRDADGDLLPVLRRPDVRDPGVRSVA